MDVNKYIESGILEEFVFGTLSTEEMVEVHDLSMQHPEILLAINEIDVDVVPKIAIPAPSGLLGKIMAGLPPEGNSASSDSSPTLTKPSPEKEVNNIITGYPTWMLLTLSGLLIGSLLLNIWYAYSGDGQSQDIIELNDKVKKLEDQITLTEGLLLGCEEEKNRILVMVNNGYETGPVAHADPSNTDNTLNGIYLINRSTYDIQMFTNDENIEQGKQLVAWAVNGKEPHEYLGPIGKGNLKTPQMRGITHIGISTEDLANDNPSKPAEGTVGAYPI